MDSLNRKSLRVTILAIMITAASQHAMAQHAISHGTFVSAGLPSTGSHALYQTIAQGPVGVSSDGTLVVSSGFWPQAYLSSTVEVAFSLFDALLEDFAVVLSWDISVTSPSAGVNIYRTEDLEKPFIKINDDPLPVSYSGSYTDLTAAPGRTWHYELGVIEEGKESRSAVVSISIPGRPLTLFQNYPNPFNPATIIRYYQPEAGDAELVVYDVTGRRVAVLASGPAEAGDHLISWNGLNSNGSRVQSGVYYYRLTNGKHSITKKLIVLR